MTEKKLRGFARLNAEERIAAARKGGQSVPAEKRAFSDRAFAALAGSLGGKSVPPDKRGFALNRKLASEAGRKGGEAAKKNP